LAHRSNFTGGTKLALGRNSFKERRDKNQGANGKEKEGGTKERRKGGSRVTEPRKESARVHQKKGKKEKWT